MINFDEVTGKCHTKDNPKWPYISDHLRRILIIGSSVTGKTNPLLNLINQMLIKYIYIHNLPILSKISTINKKDPSRCRKKTL